MLLRQTPVALALAFAFGVQAQTASTAPTAPAAPANAASAAPQLAELTVSATRTERATDAVPNTVSVYGRKALERRDARDLKELLKDEVDLAVRASTPRFGATVGSSGRAGNEGINIRGLEGNQVLMMVDGIRLPQSFAFGPFASGRADHVGLDGLASAEVLRGPASAQYGSDGLAGALSLRTLSAQDLLKNGKTFAGYGLLSAASVDDSRQASTALAFANGPDGAAGRWDALLQASVLRGHEMGNQGDNKAPNSDRTAPNPADIRSHSLLAKLGWRPLATHRLEATLDLHERKTDSDVLSARARTASTASSVLALQARDKLERRRVSLRHDYEDLNATWLQKAQTTLYVQDSETRQHSFEDRNTASDRVRDGRYRERVVGLSSLGQTQLSSQRLSYGLDLSRNTLRALRDGSLEPGGEAFPSKPFPDTRYTLAGAFVQSEIETGSLSLIPALRFDHYKLSPSSAGYNGTVVSLSDQAVTPRMGLVWRASESLQPYLQWARGFRAPTPDQVNNGFSNEAHGYISIGNPDLKPERANSWELGLRGRIADTLRWQLSAYDNRYQDFIKQQVIRGSGRPKDPMVFQYINLTDARIRGVEARAWWQATRGLSLSAAVASARGHSRQNGVDTPLDTVQPLTASLSARYEQSHWHLQASLQHSAAKKASQVSDPSYYAPPGYDVIDVGGGVQLSQSLSLSAWITNLTDKTYWRWSDVRGVSADSPVLAAFTAPGRALRVSLRAEF
ncbi:TonB-dependent hemoglobin/transferrin/lactoferrin family receptor [Pelomonas sp. CA6]|uniref:TonB-dependent hemoglobin/transferrin/lactoferrin family receptor n=1 Tax=Pelomonas sp. CA6 TaxID=2907999 RepID=UPI001F4BDC46|nr:TonB-dependent hemoglobin/transferrin/lactoferrin family receptor [Pelomonas sp. CA6]MCH7343676.1 TonB-dependent hemoglobin/transferrin/lactoferrin family receptor [Pelomonas sp. CA6]